MTPTWVQLVYLACAVCFILALKGLSGPKTARTGNLIGAVAAVVACAVPFFYLDLDHIPLILGAIVIGTAGGVFGAQRVQMTQMPQMVALFNGVGGGAAALVALLELHVVVEVGGNAPWFDLAAQFADEWDQTAFDPDYDTLPLEHFEPLVRERFASGKLI